MKINTANYIELEEWDRIVSETYGRIYSLQQQDGCMDRQTIHIQIPNPETLDDEMYDSIPEVVNDPIMGVKFAKWLERDPNQPLVGQTHDFERRLWWERNFYPDLQTVANDLHAKGLIPAGNYRIEIDW